MNLKLHIKYQSKIGAECVIECQICCINEWEIAYQCKIVFEYEIAYQSKIGAECVLALFVSARKNVTPLEFLWG